MDPEDHFADLEEENRILRSRLAEAEDKVRRLEEELQIALHRKVEEVDEGIPPEEVTHQIWNRAKKEEATGSGPSTTVTKHKVKIRVKRNKTEHIHNVDEALVVPVNGESRLRPQPGPTPANRQDSDDDDIGGDSARYSPRKRRSERDQSNPRPEKRRNFWVEVPPRRKRALSLSVKREPEAAVGVESTAIVVKRELDQEEFNALSIIRNTGIKPDKKSLDDVSVFTRLSRVGLDVLPVTIEDRVKELSVPRQGFLSKHFGGSSIPTHPTVSPEKLKRYGFDNFMYIPLSLHIHAPSLPGAPGLWMCICDCYGSADDLRVIVRVQTKPALWLYVGQYDARPSDPFSTQEWAMQSDQTKEEWAAYIRREPWGSSTCARIRIRQVKGREPTEGEIKQLIKPPGHSNSRKHEDYGVTEADILEAFDKGEERLYTWTLKCRGYDERFQKTVWDLAEAKGPKEEK